MRRSLGDQGRIAASLDAREPEEPATSRFSRLICPQQDTKSRAAKKKEIIITPSGGTHMHVVGPMLHINSYSSIYSTAARIFFCFAIFSLFRDNSVLELHQFCVVSRLSDLRIFIFYRSIRENQKYREEVSTVESRRQPRRKFGSFV